MKTHDASLEAAHGLPAATAAHHTVGRPVGAIPDKPLAAQAYINRSPRMLAQRRALRAVFGKAIQLEADPQTRKEEMPLQLRRDSGTPSAATVPTVARTDPDAAPINLTGMPDPLKAGIESLSSLDMSDVRVHRNSDKPAQLNALAYAQGNDIHLGPGQEQHLPHEAWHLVQQRQGRVQATIQMAGVGVNDQMELEKEADQMGQTAVLQGAGLSTGNQRQDPMYKPAAIGTTPGPAPQGQERAIVQRRIGAGGILLRGRIVIDTGGQKYEIVNDHEFRGRLEYKLQTKGGTTLFVDADDDRYKLYAGYSGVLGFDGREQERTAIEFTVKRRHDGPRTLTSFSDPRQAKTILVKQCDVPIETAENLIEKSDWSYPMLKQLMEILAKDDALQPGLDEGSRLWQEAQPEKIYTIRTTDVGSQLAQLVGCHLMEYQETNSGTQGPRQSKDVSRQHQLELTSAILSLPEDRVAKHAIGLGQPQHIGQFPAPFDIRFEGGGVFGKSAGTVTYKAYQSAIKNRDQSFDHTDTLVDEARGNRKETTKAALTDKSFNVDRMELFEAEDFIQAHLGVKDTESDNSMEEDDDWEAPLTQAEVGQWTLEQLHEYVFKHNVYSGVLLKETAAKLAEVEIMETDNPHTGEQDKLSAIKHRRKGVQNQIQRATDALANVMQSLGIDVPTIVTRLQQWKNKSALLQSKNSSAAKDYKRSLRKYSETSLVTLQQQGYPPPLPGIGDKTLKEC
jgi:hypothetical protein